MKINSLNIRHSTIGANLNTIVITCCTFTILTVYSYLLLEHSDRTLEPLPTFTPQLTLILSQQRSGSSWVGSIFDSDPDIFYLFEPLHTKIYQSAALQLSTFEAQVEILNNICTCNFGTALPSFGVLEHSNVGLEAQTLLHDVDRDYLTRRCKDSAVRIAKVVKITDIKTLERFKTRYPHCKLDIIHLVRDPRGSIHSRMQTFGRFFPGEVTSSEFTVPEVREGARLVCEGRLGLVRGLAAFRGAEKILTVKYEEVVEDPQDSLSSIFSELDIPFSDHVRRYITQSSRASNEDPGGFETSKNSRAVYNQWKKTMLHEHLAAATESCLEVLEILKYEP